MKLPDAGANQDGGCATATGLAPVSRSATTRGRLPVADTPRVTTWLAVEPDSAIAKYGAGETGNKQSRPAGASKPERSPTRLSGRAALVAPVVQPGPAT